MSKHFAKSSEILHSRELPNKEFKILKYKEMGQHIIVDNLRKENSKLKAVISDLTSKNIALNAEIETIRKIAGISSPKEKCETKDTKQTKDDDNYIESEWVLY